MPVCQPQIPYNWPLDQAAPIQNGELDFETDEVESFHSRLEAAGVEFIHALREQPWGQRVLRFYDPDGHVIEIGESMEAVVARIYAQAWRRRRSAGGPRCPGSTWMR